MNHDEYVETKIRLSELKQLILEIYNMAAKLTIEQIIRDRIEMYERRLK